MFQLSVDNDKMVTIIAGSAVMQSLCDALDENNVFDNVEMVTLSPGSAVMQSLCDDG